MWKYQIDLKKFYDLWGNETVEEKIIVEELKLIPNTFKTYYNSYNRLNVLMNKGFLRRFQKNKIIYWELTQSGRIALNELFEVECLTDEDVSDMTKKYLRNRNPIAELRMQGTK